MHWKPIEIRESGDVKIPKRWLHMHYYEALNILFRFENSLRVLVYITLKNEAGDAWSATTINQGGNSIGTIQTVAAKRIAMADNFGYLGYDVKAPLMHLTSGELVDLITESKWQLFKQYFRGSKEIIKTKLLEIGTIRNALAHFRPIRANDIEVAKLNCDQTLGSVDNCLKNLFSQYRRVPTNTDEEWYKAISALSSSEIAVILNHSEDEQWVNVQLSFKPTCLSKTVHWDNYYAYELLRLDSVAILSHSNIKKSCTYVSEGLSFASVTPAGSLDVTKYVNIVFHTDRIRADGLEVAEALDAVIKCVSEECALLSSDSLARGKFVSAAHVTAYRESTEERWKINVEALRRAYAPSDPDEYWGEIQYVSEVVAACRRYPWMAEDISEQEGFLD